jgi:hypothetical protein
MAVALTAVVSQATLANDGRPSRQALAEMGLGGLAVMSDDEALSIRGQGFYNGGSSVKVWGNSFATINTPIGGSHSENGYVAEGKHYASGKNYSKAGVTISWSKGKPGHGDGGYGGGMPTSWNQGGGDMPGGGYPGGGMPGSGHPGGGYSSSITIKFFAGGSSSAWAF